MLNRFFNWLADRDPEIQELDRRIEAADIRIAQKEKYLKELQEDCNQKQQRVKELKDGLDRLQKSSNRQSN